MERESRPPQDTPEKGDKWPEGFNAIAERFLMAPEELAYLLCVDLVKKNPRRLIVIES